MAERAGTVLVVGSVNVDLVVRVAALPAPGETVGGGTFDRGPGGKGGNQAAAAARLGARTLMVGRVGDDDLGRAARADLQDAGVDTRYLADDPGGPTGVAAVLVDAHGENAIAVAPGVNAAVDAGQVRRALDDATRLVGGPGGALPAAPVLVTNLEVPMDAVRAAAAHGRRLGWRVVLDPAPARPLPADLLACVDVLTPNRLELDPLHPGGVRGLLAAGVGAVLVTRGADGVEVHLPGAAVEAVPAVPVDVVDTTGAGDGFTGALAWALAAGRPLGAAVRLAAAAGALTTTHHGARGPLDPEAVARLVG